MLLDSTSRAESNSEGPYKVHRVFFIFGAHFKKSMANKTYRPDTNKAHKIVAEVMGKVTSYESRMTNRLANWIQMAELYSGKLSTSKENAVNSPNSAELYKAIRAMRNMLMRMLLGQKPCFELESMDIIGFEQPERLLKAEHYVTNQMDLARFDKGLARTLDQLLLYGSVAVHNPYEPLRASFLGRRHYVTKYRPISLINCAFSLDAYDIEESGWVALSDVQSSTELDKLAHHDPDGKVYDRAAIASAKAQSGYTPQVNTWVTQRMAYQGYVNTNFTGGIERTTYYGPLDCLNDKEEYCVEIVNRQHIIRMEAYDGLRPVRIATIDNIDVEPLGNGMGDKFKPLLNKIDNTESALLNMVTLAGANMYAKQKSLTDEDMEFTLRQFGIMSLENPILNPIAPDPRNLMAVANYAADQVQKFRQASGATDTLQALVSGDQATATATSLAMNEAVRNLSVLAQCLSPVLVQDYVKQILQNVQKYNTEPFVININGAPVTILPSELLIDLNVRVKTSTDQDFRPTKLMRLREGIQLMAMFGPNAIPGKKMNPGPALMEYFKELDVPRYTESIQDVTDQDLLAMRMQAEMGAPAQAGQGGEEEAGEDRGEARVAAGKPGRHERRELNRNMSVPMAEQTMQTPAGQVLTAPGDSSETFKTIRRSGVGAE